MQRSSRGMTGRVCMSRLDAAWLVLHAGWPRWLILDSYHTEGRIPESPCLLSFLHVQSLVVVGVDAVISSVPFAFHRGTRLRGSIASFGAGRGGLSHSFL